MFLIMSLTLDEWFFCVCKAFLNTRTIFRNDRTLITAIKSDEIILGVTAEGVSNKKC